MSNLQDGPALANIFERLQPDIFHHPVWVHFIQESPHQSESTIHALQLQIQQMIATGDLSGAGQTLLLCAALDKIAGNYQGAIDSIEQAWSLAELHHLPQVVLWAAWGSCALYTLSGQTNQAVKNLIWIRNHLTGEKSWIIAGLFETIETVLSAQVELDSSLNIILNWLLDWGAPLDLAGYAEKVHPEQPPRKILMDYTRREPHLHVWWRKHWQTLLQIIHGELRLEWVRPSQGLDRDQLILAPQQTTPGPTMLPFPGIVLDLKQVDQTPIEPVPGDLRAGPPAVELVLTGLAEPPTRKSTKISLAIYCFGSFRVILDGQVITTWPSGKGKAILKYMIAYSERPVSKDILMDTFWRDAEPEAARKNLYVAIHGLRQAFKSLNTDFPFILFREDHYFINPELSVWVDVKEFAERVQSGHSLEKRGSSIEAIREYEAAESLYQGDFLEEDLYEDWPIPLREGLKDQYLSILDRLSRYYLEVESFGACIQFCQKILTKDDCREDAHRRLMRCYSRQGQRNLALRQYHLCMEALMRELEVQPTQATVILYQKIRDGERI